jgi:hypothetical protein
MSKHTHAFLGKSCKMHFFPEIIPPHLCAPCKQKLSLPDNPGNGSEFFIRLLKSAFVAWISHFRN